MTASLKIYLAQLNQTVGALKENSERIAASYRRALAEGADLVMTPELSLCGYTPEDLVRKPYFVAETKKYLLELAKITKDPAGPGLIVGLPWEEEDKLYNTLALLEAGQIAALCFKSELPNYLTFDEKRIFDAAQSVQPILFRGVKLGLMICEDMWRPDTARKLKALGAELLLVPHASPYEWDKMNRRHRVARARVNETGLALVFCNQRGGQDELVFDGAGFVMDSLGKVTSQLRPWHQENALISFQKEAETWQPVAGICADLPSIEEEIYQAMCMGLRDYMAKNGFKKLVLGLSGGIDSALSAAVAVDALGADKVHAVMMPSRFTSAESLNDAKSCAALLGIRYDIIDIEPLRGGFDQALAPLFMGHIPDVTEENIQSRLRAVLLMALSNKFGAMLLTTGNKSELAVGYATLYGDMCGGFNVLKDLYKSDVFKISEWRNQVKPHACFGPDGAVMPQNIIEKEPSAELRDNQKDADSLPPYERLDPILQGLIEEEASAESLIQRGFERREVAQIERLLYMAEYKRRQAPPGVKLSNRNFGRDRRYPLTNHFRTYSEKNL